MIITGYEKDKLGSPMDQITDGASVFSRVEPLVTPDALSNEYLMGIPLYSFLPDPVTRKRAEYTPVLLKRAIAKAIAEVESDAKVAVQVVQKTRRLPFDANQYRSLGYFRIPDRPILQIQKLAVRPAGSQAEIYIINPQWIDNANFHRGQVNLVPFMPAASMSGSPMITAMTTGAGAAFLSVIGQLGWVPSFWEMEYTVGFEEGRIPVLVNDLIGVIAAKRVLEDLQATNRIAQYSVGLDSANQSVATGGSEVYAEKIKSLEERRQRLTSKIKKKFGQALFSGEL
jgi:hypothetical protein